MVPLNAKNAKANVSAWAGAKHGHLGIWWGAAILSAVCCASSKASAQDAPPTVREADAAGVKTAAPSEVRKIDDDQYLVGGVTLRKSTREISFDAKVNQTGGLIEFLLVTEQGKVHESLFASAIRPIDLHVAFKLLSYPESPELFEIRTADYRPTGKYPKVSAEVKIGARLAISATWQIGGIEKNCPVNELIKDTSTGKAMPPGPWLFTGSLVTKAGFLAEANGDIAAVFANQAAVVNYPGNGCNNDEVWFVDDGKLPAKDTPVRITIRPFSKTSETTHSSR